MLRRLELRENASSSAAPPRYGDAYRRDDEDGRREASLGAEANDEFVDERREN
ncbi:esterase/lipase [Eggerthella sp. YY7918]|nr:esterase/lipase [Eggerthella sp. YY7918]